MNVLKKTLLATILFLTTPLVAAQSQNPFSSIADLIQNLALSLGQIVTLGGVSGSNETIVLKFIFFIMVFTAFFMAGQVALKDRDQTRKYAGIFAGLIALTATILVPSAFITSFSGTLTIIIMSLMFLAVIGLPLYIMYSFVPDVSNKNDTVVGLTKILLSIVTIFTLSLYSQTLNLNQQAPQNIAGQGIGGAFGQVVIDILGTLTGLVLLIFVVTLILGIKQAWPKSKKKKTKSGDEWYKNIGPSDEDVINREIEDTIEDLDNVRQGQMPLIERIQDYVNDARKELNKPTGGRLTKVIGYLNNVLEDINSQDRQETLIGKIKEKKEDWDNHRDRLKEKNKKLGNLIKSINSLMKEAAKGTTNKQDLPEARSELIIYLYEGGSSLEDWLDDFNDMFKKKAKRTSRLYQSLFSDIHSFEELKEEADNLSEVDIDALDKTFERLKKDAKKIEKNAMRAVGDLGRKARNVEAKKNAPKLRKEIDNIVSKIENNLRGFREDFDELKKQVVNVENILENARV